MGSRIFLLFSSVLMLLIISCGGDGDTAEITAEESDESVDRVIDTVKSAFIKPENVKLENIKSASQAAANPQVLLNKAKLGISDDASQKILTAMVGLRQTLEIGGGFYNPTVVQKKGTSNTYEIVKEDDSTTQNEILTYIYGAEKAAKIQDKSKLTFHRYQYIDYQKTTDTFPITMLFYSVKDPNAKTVTLKGGCEISLTISADKGLKLALWNGDQSEVGLVLDANNIIRSGTLLIASYVKTEGKGQSSEERPTVFKRYDISNLSATDKVELAQFNITEAKT